MNIMLRPSILYACETYYNLKESEIRQIERIEENYMRRLFKTSKGCPINQLYLELGQIPARFEILKLRLLFLKYILNQDEKSLIKRFFLLQIEQPTRGDWASTCVQNLKELCIFEPLEEIEKMTKNKFKNILKEKIKKEAFVYLIKNKGIKGKEINYPVLKMADYLLPNKTGISIEDQRSIFSVRNRMVNIPDNFSSQQNGDLSVTKCICSEKENMEHIYTCNKLNKETVKLPYQKIFSGNIEEQIYIFRRFQNNFEIRNYLIRKQDQTSPHVILNFDPLISDRVLVMDNK